MWTVIRRKTTSTPPSAGRNEFVLGHELSWWISCQRAEQSKEWKDSGDSNSGFPQNGMFDCRRLLRRKPTCDVGGSGTQQRNVRMTSEGENFPSKTKQSNNIQGGEKDPYIKQRTEHAPWWTLSLQVWKQSRPSFLLSQVWVDMTMSRQNRDCFLVKGNNNKKLFRY